MDSSHFKDIYRRAREGDLDARDEIVLLYRDRLARFIDRHAGAEVRRRAEPDDIFQTTVLTLLDRLPTFPEDLESDELCAYVLQLARWRVADVLKKKDREVGESQLPESPAAPRDTRADRGSVGSRASYSRSSPTAAASEPRGCPPGTTCHPR